MKLRDVKLTKVNVLSTLLSCFVCMSRCSPNATFWFWQNIPEHFSVQSRAFPQRKHNLCILAQLRTGVLSNISGWNLWVHWYARELHPCRLRTEKMTHTQISIIYYDSHQIIMQNEDYSSTTSDRQFIYSERFLAWKEEQRTAAPLLRDMSKGDSMAEHRLYPQLLKSSVWANGAAQPRVGHITEQAAQVFRESCAFEVVLLSCLQDGCRLQKLSFFSPVCTGMEAGNICSQAVQGTALEGTSYTGVSGK